MNHLLKEFRMLGIPIALSIYIRVGGGFREAQGGGVREALYENLPFRFF